MEEIGKSKGGASWLKALLPRVGAGLLGLAFLVVVVVALWFGIKTYELDEGLAEGFELQGTYGIRVEVDDGAYREGRLSFADKPAGDHDGLWQISGRWKPDSGYGRMFDNYYVVLENGSGSCLINGYFDRTVDPNMVVLKTREGDQIGWASLAWADGEEGLLYASCDGVEMTCAKGMRDVLHYDNGEMGSLFLWAPAGVEGADPAEFETEWFEEVDPLAEP